MVRAWRALSRAVRRPVVIVTDVLALGTGAALAAALPQQPDALEIDRFAREFPALSRVTGALGLHEIVTSGWFLAIALACVVSLLAVQSEQWPRLARSWSDRLAPASFARAPFRRSGPVSRARQQPLAARFSSAGRIGLLGSPVFHLGLLLLVLAGLVRMLAFREVVVRALEGETIPAQAGAFEAERGGWLSRPFALPAQVQVRELREERYQSGALRQVAVALLTGERPGSGPEVREAAINAPLDVGDVRIYVSNAHGLAALLELGGAGQPVPLVAFLEERGGEWRGGLRSGQALELRFRTAVAPRPESVEVRALSDGVLLGIGELSPGSELALGAGRTLRLHGLRYWVQLRGSRDPSKPLFFGAVAVVVAGVVLMFSVVRVDTGVFVEGDQLVVALRPQRFAPLYAERFERLCKEWWPS